MRDAVICEPLRTPVGGFGGSLRDVPAQELAATVIRALIERTGLPPESVDDVLLGPLLPDDGRTGDRPRRRPRRRAARDRLRHPDRPPLRLGAAGRALRRDAGAVRRLGRRPRRWRGVDEQRAVLLDRHAVGRQGRSRRAAAGRPGPRPGHRRRPEPPGARRHARDGGEPAPRVQDLPRGAGRVRRPQPPAGGGRGRGRPVRRRDRPGHREGPEERHGRRPRRAHPPRLERRDARQAAPDHGQGRPRGHRHRRQRQRPERRRRHRDRHPPRARPPSSACARWPGSSPGASPACRRRPWASARCRRRRRRWPWPA